MTLVGMYTLLFGYALRELLSAPYDKIILEFCGPGLLLHKKKKRIAAALAILWALVITSFSFDWWYHHSAFVGHNKSPLDIASFLQRVSPDRVDQAIFTADNIISFSTNWLADGILVCSYCIRPKCIYLHWEQIWRCYVLWENRKWMLSPLPVLLIADISKFLHYAYCLNWRAGIVIPCVPYVPPLSRNPVIGVIFLVIFYAISTVITVVGTSLIILRILAAAVENEPRAHHSAHHNIQRIIVESGILYSTAMVLAGISLFLQLLNHSEKVTHISGQISQYCQAVLVPLSVSRWFDTEQASYLIVSGNWANINRCTSGTRGFGIPDWRHTYSITSHLSKKRKGEWQCRHRHQLGPLITSARWGNNVRYPRG